KEGFAYSTTARAAPPSAGGANASAASGAAAATRRNPFRRGAPPVRSRLCTVSLACPFGTAASVGQIAQSHAEGNRGAHQDFYPASRRIQGKRPGDRAATGAQGRRAGAGSTEGPSINDRRGGSLEETTSPGG